MAPLDPNAMAQSNLKPIALFSAQGLLVASLTANVLGAARRAARALPPSASTRAHESVRHRHTVVFSLLACLSLASVTAFAVVWRVLSYMEWAERRNHEAPGSLGPAVYGTGDEGVGRWRLGDWLIDAGRARKPGELVAAASSPEAFVYTSQHLVGLLVSAIFIGVEGRRRNLLPSTIASFVILGATSSLGYALSLFFILMLYSPVAALQSGPTPGHHSHFALKPAVLYMPVLISLLALYAFAGSLANSVDGTLVRYRYATVPLFLAFAPQIVPLSWGRHPTSRASAHRSLVRVFRVLSLASLVLHWAAFGSAMASNTPREQVSVYDLLRNALGNQYGSKTNRLVTGLGNTAQQLKKISTHPAISVTSVDVLFTTLSLLAWSFTQDLDVESMVDNGVLSFLTWRKAGKQEALNGTAKKSALEPEAEVPATPKKRGRPRKGGLHHGASTTAASSAAAGSLRRSTRKKTQSGYESEPEDCYEPAGGAKKGNAQTEPDGAPRAEDAIHRGEATALAMLLALVGGLGPVAAGVLGAKATGTGE